MCRICEADTIEACFCVLTGESIAVRENITTSIWTEVTLIHKLGVPSAKNSLGCYQNCYSSASCMMSAIVNSRVFI
jgi:hypothetical protein